MKVDKNLFQTIFYALKRTEKSFQIGFIILIFLLLGWNLTKNFDQILNYQWNINLSLLGLSILLSVMIAFSMAGIWGLIVRKYAPSVSWRNYVIIWFQSLLAKYLPGGIWNLVGRVYLCRKANVSGVAPVASITLEMLLFSFSQTITVLTLGSIYIINLVSPQVFGLIVIFSLLIGIVVHPKIFFKILNLHVLSRTNLQEIPYVNSKSFLIWLNLYILVNIVSGIAFYTFVTSIYSLPLSLMPIIVVIVNLSTLIGFLTPFAPNGLGIREALLALLLSYFMPSSIAVAISIAARIWLTVCEIISTFLGYFVFRLMKT
jgi:hypothetical protein